MDVLSDVLMSVRLTGAVFFSVDAQSPFVAESPSVAAIRERVAAGAEHVISFHVITEGSCWAETIDQVAPPISLRTGDMIAFPAGDANVLSTTPGMRGRPDLSLYVRPPDDVLPFNLRMGTDSGADHTRFVCGFLGCDSHPFNPLLDSLPRTVHSPVSTESRQWIASLLDAAVQSSGDAAAGREALLAKLAELMFVEALRAHLAGLPEGERGWLAGVRDPYVGAALRLMHGRPAEPWTLEHLAREVGMSRSAFAERFTAYVRIPPMQYLARWRLQLAARMLESDVVSIAQVASAVGYASEAAFHRAFKREVGVAPGAWRRGQVRSAARAPRREPG